MPFPRSDGGELQLAVDGEALVREQHVDHQVAERRGLALPAAVDVVLVFVAHQLELVVFLKDVERRDDLVGAAEGDGVA